MSEQDSYDAGDEVIVGKRKSKMQHRRDLELDQLRAVLSTETGRAVLWRVLEHGGLLKTSFAVDPHVTAFQEGRREQAIWLLGEIEAADVRAYQKMHAEAQERGRT
jgi:L-ascorbate metabolism protein UlaG (beta-lactamase superfamily)